MNISKLAKQKFPFIVTNIRHYAETKKKKKEKKSTIRKITSNEGETINSFITRSQFCYKEPISRNALSDSIQLSGIVFTA